MLSLKDLTRSFGSKVAVSNVSIEIVPGSFVGIIGRSGAGKSTLLRMINRLVDPSAGSITFNDINVTALRGKALREWRSRSAMIFQQFNLAPRLDVLTNVLVGMTNEVPQLRRLLRVYWRDERMGAAALLDELGLLDRALERAERLSGGEQQRVAIARALLQNPQLILADEPIASLDPQNAMIVMDTLRRINRERGITVICNLHSLEIARSYADRIVGLNAGRLVFDGPVAALTPAAVTEVYGRSSETEDQSTAIAA
ncbi:MAG: phosphonate ABC transporter ATP-binding protein [Pseudolabrys sp.]|nr:phosphonate ABC transporter ATP-binding protein [Pseudolabrys sp.]MDP2295668.1 phosphonate ABC transporter ATP-binding protein [Pseudolabrys sp.]